MYCRRCGAEISEDVNYCNICGAPLRPEPAPPAPPPRAENKVFIAVIGSIIIISVLVLPSVLLEEASLSALQTPILEAADYDNPVTRDYALSLVRSTHSGEYNIFQVCDIWEGVYSQWVYVGDPRGEDYFSPASRTINISLKGDCDDYAIVVASLVGAIGGEARVVAASDISGNGHAFAEALVAHDYDDLQEISGYICERYGCERVWYQERSDIAGNSDYWINLDWQSNHPGGEFCPMDEIQVIYLEGYSRSLEPGDEPVLSISV